MERREEKEATPSLQLTQIKAQFAARLSIYLFTFALILSIDLG